MRGRLGGSHIALVFQVGFVETKQILRFRVRLYILTNSNTEKRNVMISISNDSGSYDVSFELPGMSKANVSVRDAIIRCYKNDGSIQVLSYVGNLKNLVMEHGVNNIRATDGINISVIPNWRRL